MITDAAKQKVEQGSLNRMMNNEKSAVTPICDFPLSVGSMTENLAMIQKGIAEHKGGWLVTLNTEMLARMVRDPAYRDLLKGADYYFADGMPLVWASRYKPTQIAGRTTGVDIVDALLKLEEPPRFAVIGGINPAQTISTYANATEACKFLFDGKVTLAPDQIKQFAEEIRRLEIGIVFLALGVPKQDQLAKALQAELPGVWLIGVGGTFEILGPDGARAPLWMQKKGLEWLYRLFSEPARLWRRYLVEYPAGIYLLLKDHFSKQEIGS